jgi:hypothetical protein
MKVGDKVYLEPRGGVTRRNKEVIICTISKVGRKYFEAEELLHCRFFKKELVHDGKDYPSEYTVHLNKQDLLDCQERTELHNKARKAFDHYGGPRLSLKTLRSVIELIDQDDE